MIHIHDSSLNNIEKEILFPSFLYSAKVNVSNHEILEECDSIRKIFKYTNQRSNINGWQSPVFNSEQLNKTYIDSDYPKIKKLSQIILEFCNKISISEELNIEFLKIFWWVNYNGKNSYNVIHSHPHTDLVALYYPKINPNNGSLVIVRTDALNVHLFQKREDRVRHHISPEIGIIYIFPAYLLHYVENNFDDDERISVAFNISVI